MCKELVVFEEGVYPTRVSHYIYQVLNRKLVIVSHLWRLTAAQLV